MSGHQQTIYTIHESQLNNGSGNGANQGRDSYTDVLIDTSSIPMTQQPLPIIQHQHLQPTPAPGQPQLQSQAQQQQLDTITGQPLGNSARVAPEDQNIVYSVHPVFSMLDQHDTLLIRQKADCTSTCCGFESVNTYTVRSKDGAPIFKATEKSNCLERCCFEGNREYNLELVHGEETVARVRKAHRVSRFCCYSNAVRIESPEDNPIGNIKQVFTLFGHPRYAIFDSQQSPKTPSFHVESVSCRFCCTPFLCTCICGNNEFKIVSVESKEVVGSILRDCSADFRFDTGACGGGGSGGANGGGNNSSEEASGSTSQQTESQNNEPAGQQQDNDASDPFNNSSLGAGGGGQVFGVQFEANLEARQKVLLLSACFMMDFFYFENDRRRRKLTRC